MQNNVKKIIGVLIVIIGSVFVLYSLWFVIGSTIYAIKMGPNSGSSLGQAFGIVGLLISSGILLLGRYFFKGDV